MNITIPLILAVLAATAMGQATRPSNPAVVIAQLKEENARLKAEVQELRDALDKLRPAPMTTQAEFSSLRALLKQIPAKLILPESTGVKERERQEWFEQNIYGKTLTAEGELQQADIDEIGRITLRILEKDKGSTNRVIMLADFAGTVAHRKAIAGIDVGDRMKLAGKVRSYESFRELGAIIAIIHLDDCQLVQK